MSTANALWYGAAWRRANIALAAEEYVAARLAMSENKQDQLAMILRVDSAWAALVDAVDPQ